MAEDGRLGAGLTPQAVDISACDFQTEVGKNEGKGKKRSLFGFGKKKMETSSMSGSGAESSLLSKEPSTLSSTSRSATSPTRVTQSDFPSILPGSPTRAFTNSPRLSSPATSQIFERDVQDNTVVKSTSPAIPTHIRTENHIPPVLDDASEAITNHKLDPDTVEIVTHTSHQPASVTVTGTGAGAVSTPYDQSTSEWARELASFADRIGLSPETASNYGSLESADVRRLSFISFADVVQSEHGGQHLATMGSRDNMRLAGLTSLSPSAMNRSPSPIRSPISSQGPGTSPPTSNPGSIAGMDLSPHRRPLGSPSSTHYNLAAPGDLNIETMTQALRRTGSADLSNVRSIPQNPMEGLGSR